MFFKQVCIVIVVICIFGYIFGDWVLIQQAHYMVEHQYTIPAYEAYEKVVKYYPSSKYVKEAKAEMEKLRETSGDLQVQLKKSEAEYRKVQQEREKKESFR